MISEFKSALIVGAFFLFILGLLTLFVLSTNFNWVMYFAAYIVGSCVFGLLFYKSSHKVAKTIRNVLFFPLTILLFLFRIIMPGMTLIIHIITYFLIVAIIPTVVKILYDKTDIINISEQTLLFLCLSFVSIISVILCKPILKLVYRFDFARINEDNAKRLDKMKVNDITNYTVTSQNIRFLIYAFYLIFTIVFSIRLFESEDMILSKSNDTAIMQAFLVFLAFDNVHTNSKSLILKASDFLKLLIASIFRAFPNEDEQKQSDNS